ncbi:hypothetical protein SAMN04488078_107821 [Antarctobacter heliothermus]|uniref:Uncharacterized protein n=1 Tax=Antarctobacter heliothermus TaxID=74033 RepID=A0A239L3B4_9RHOB|nr:hypothetical protein SAMN04488078_107821 [Antarctobacter heliothermus]
MAAGRANARPTVFLAGFGEVWAGLCPACFADGNVSMIEGPLAAHCD